MIGRQDRWQEDLFVAGPLSSLVPDDHILKQVDKVLDLSWLRDEVKDLYCCDNGRPGIGYLDIWGQHTQFKTEISKVSPELPGRIQQLLR